MRFKTLQFRLSALVFTFGLLMIGLSVSRQYRRDVNLRFQQMRLHAYEEGTRLSSLAQHFFRKRLLQSTDLAVSYASVQPDLRLGVISDGNDIVRNATLKQWRGVLLWDCPLAISPHLIARAKEHGEGLLEMDSKGETLTALFPFIDVARKGKRGLVVLEYDLRGVVTGAVRHMMNELAAEACLLFGGCLLLWALMQMVVTERVSLIAAQTLQLGVDETIPVPIGGADELAAISSSIAKAAHRLQASEWRFSQIASNMRDVFWVAPPNHAESAYVNHAYERLFGRPAASLRSSRWDWLKSVDREDRHAALSMLRHLRREAGEMEIEIRVYVGQRLEWLRCRGFSASRQLDKAGRLQVAGMAAVITEEKEMEKQLIEAAEAESRRIGQDLHDDVCQRLAAAQLKSGVLGSSLKREGHPQAVMAVDVARELAEASEIARGFARGLAPVAVGADELPDALDDLRKFLERAFSLRCQVDCDDLSKLLNTKQAAQLFRIAQELATNAAKHGQATWVSISLIHASGVLRLEVTNDGVSFDPRMDLKRKGMGLHMARQRADALGASLSFRPRAAADGGTLAVVEMPLFSLPNV